METENGKEQDWRYQSSSDLNFLYTVLALQY